MVCTPQERHHPSPGTEKHMVVLNIYEIGSSRHPLLPAQEPVSQSEGKPHVGEETPVIAGHTAVSHTRQHRQPRLHIQEQRGANIETRLQRRPQPETVATAVAILDALIFRAKRADQFKRPPCPVASQQRCEIEQIIGRHASEIYVVRAFAYRVYAGAKPNAPSVYRCRPVTNGKLADNAGTGIGRCHEHTGSPAQKQAVAKPFAIEHRIAERLLEHVVKGIDPRAHRIVERICHFRCGILHAAYSGHSDKNRHPPSHISFIHRHLHCFCDPTYLPHPRADRSGRRPPVPPHAARDQASARSPDAQSRQGSCPRGWRR